MSCMTEKTQLRNNLILPGSSNQFIVRLPKFKVARVFNEKIFLEAIPKSVQYTTRDEYDYDIDARYMTSRHNGMLLEVKFLCIFSNITRPLKKYINENTLSSAYDFTELSNLITSQSFSINLILLLQNTIG